MVHLFINIMNHAVGIFIGGIFLDWGLVILIICTSGMFHFSMSESSIQNPEISSVEMRFLLKSRYLKLEKIVTLRHIHKNLKK